jgi:arginyl-tRNA synthetase
VYEGFDATYKQMGVYFDTTYYESDTYLLGKDIVEEGLEKGVFFRREDRSVWVDLSDEGMDEKLLLRKDGTSVYMTQDMGTADLKYRDHGCEKSVYVVGNEQDYHFKVLFSILKKLGRSYADGLYHLSYGMVDLPSGKMKSREGTVVDADDLMQEMLDTAARHTEELGKVEGLSPEEASELYRMLGLGALKFYLLRVDPKKRILFNPEESVEFQGYTAPFIQYTHARIASLRRRAEQLGIDYTSGKWNTASTRLAEEELAVIRLLSEYPSRLENAGIHYDPALLAQYAYELAKEYNRFYAAHSIFNQESELHIGFRVALSLAVAKTIKAAMELLGIDVPERM